MVHLFFAFITCFSSHLNALENCGEFENDMSTLRTIAFQWYSRLENNTQSSNLCSDRLWIEFLKNSFNLLVFCLEHQVFGGKTFEASLNEHSMAYLSGTDPKQLVWCVVECRQRIFLSVLLHEFAITL